MQVRRRKLLRYSARDSALFHNGVGTTRRGEWFLTAETSFPEYPIEVQAVDFPSTCKIKAKSYRFWNVIIECEPFAPPYELSGPKSARKRLAGIKECAAFVKERNRYTS